MIIVEENISFQELLSLAKNRFGNMVKAVVDVRQGVMAVDAELHADEEAMLLENDSRQEDLWGINLYPELNRHDPDFIEFDSMINLRPSQGNLIRGVENEATRRKIIDIVNRLVT